METTFKVLMHCGEYVDVSMLEKGVYSTNRPYLYCKDTTIESLIENAELMKSISSYLFQSDKYFDNLQKCELVEVYLTIDLFSKLNGSPMFPSKTN